MSNTQMKLVDHYNFLLDEIDQLRREVRKIVSRHKGMQTQHRGTIDRLALVNLSLDIHFEKRMLKIHSRMEAEVALEKMKEGTE